MLVQHQYQNQLNQPKQFPNLCFRSNNIVYPGFILVDVGSMCFIPNRNDLPTEPKPNHTWEIPFS